MSADVIDDRAIDGRLDAQVHPAPSEQVDTIAPDPPTGSGRRLARPLEIERQWVATGTQPGSPSLDRFERAVIFAMHEASRMKVDGA